MHFKLKTLLRRSVNCVLVVCVMLMSLWPAVAAYAAAEAGKAASVNVSPGLSAAVQPVPTNTPSRR